MITSRAGETHKKRAFELGVNEYVGKPYNESDLVELIRKYLGQKAVVNA
jgi:chemosensory pili system protein ChpA (sensor histidine kinase/response regulator)